MAERFIRPPTAPRNPRSGRPPWILLSTLFASARSSCYRQTSRRRSMPRTSIQPSNRIRPGSVQRMRTHPPSWKCRARDFQGESRYSFGTDDVAALACLLHRNVLGSRLEARKSMNTLRLGGGSGLCGRGPRGAIPCVRILLKVALKKRPSPQSADEPRNPVRTQYRHHARPRTRGHRSCWRLRSSARRYRRLQPMANAAAGQLPGFCDEGTHGLQGASALKGSQLVQNRPVSRQASVDTRLESATSDVNCHRFGAHQDVVTIVDDIDDVIAEIHVQLDLRVASMKRASVGIKSSATDGKLTPSRPLGAPFVWANSARPSPAPKESAGSFPGTTCLLGSTRCIAYCDEADEHPGDLPIVRWLCLRPTMTGRLASCLSKAAALCGTHEGGQRAQTFQSNLLQSKAP